jgi:hypothetical protein
MENLSLKQFPLLHNFLYCVLKYSRSRILDPMRRVILSIYLIFPPALGPGVYSASNRNEYKRRK